MEPRDNRDTFFQGDAIYMRPYPFAMKDWEIEIMHGAYAPVVEALNRGERREPRVPFWFRAWLALRTAIANRTRHQRIENE